MSVDLVKLLSDFFNEFTPVLSFQKAKDYVPIDLSVDNSFVQNLDVENPKNMHKSISDYLTENNGKVAYGGYLEKRNLYDRSGYFNGATKRNIHLGIDLWCSAETKVLAPIEGKIHSFANNLNFGDYGPTIILKHELNRKVFYSLYGHLSKKSLTHIEVGDTVQKGQVIAQLGDENENGSYAPHLHFQIINDIQSFQGDYPGVSDEKSVGFYKENCPDPNLILGLK